MDKWYSNFGDFLAERDLFNKPERIWNADKTGFQMGSKAGYIIEQSKKKFPTQVPHMSGSSTKARLTVMFSASASGSMMPSFYVSPEPPPKGVSFELLITRWICSIYRERMDGLCNILEILGSLRKAHSYRKICFIVDRLCWIAHQS
ncbi:hypothetical protein DPMN_029296 [Dreissena polymorpha]|uniref:Uncharacterized protein n=1 Tax=Dreissena polymorpha TaxID=45954 RepID=A0A9D4RGZ8_DREPO|nr:hypothetical protein DPMN_029296 [Dreissena polymorpha]